MRSVLTGPPGTGEVGWPSDARGVVGEPPEALAVTEALPILTTLEEREGIAIVCALNLTIEMPIVIDGMDNRVADPTADCRTGCI